MGNHAAVEYCDCRHFSLIKKKCMHCLKIVCSSCFGFALVNYDKHAQKQEKIRLNKVCKACFIAIARVDDLSTDYEIIGGENGTCLLMIHSEGLSRAMFKKYAFALREKGFRCILIDLPGHGSLIREQFTYQNYSKCIQRVIERQIGINYFYVLACSLPALAFMQFLSENKVKCRRAILLSTGSCLASTTNNSANNKNQQLICPNGESLIKLVFPSDNVKTGVLRSILQGGLYPISRNSLLQFQKRMNFPSCLSHLKGNLKLLFINGEFQDRRQQSIYHDALSPSSSLFTYLKVGAFFWCYRIEYYKLLNDLGRFLQQS